MRGNDESVTLSVFSEGTLQNWDLFLSERESGWDVHLVQKLCPGHTKGTSQHSICITSGRTKRGYATKQDRYNLQKLNKKTCAHRNRIEKTKVEKK